ncbi:MAG TPA: helix-turn-helix domain-containing protein [Clostridia bacterium]
MFTFNNKQYNCPMEMTMDLIGGKWKVLILWHLSFDGTLRFNELKRFFPEVTQKMLTQQLRDLETSGLINRKVYPQVPPKVEYSLTDFGKTLTPVLLEMNKWGTHYANNKTLD